LSRAGAATWGAVAAALVRWAAVAPVQAAPLPAVGLHLEAEIPLSRTQFGQPVAVAAAPFGRVFVADYGRGQVARVDSIGGLAYAFETPSDQPALQPLDLEVTGFQVYVVDAQSASLLRYSDQGGFLDVLRKFRDTGIETPRAIAVDGAGRLLLVETTRHAVRLIEESQRVESVIGGFGARVGELSRPLGVAFTTGGAFYVADTGNARVQRFSAVGNFAAAFGDSLREPCRIAGGAGGELFVTDVRREMVLLYEPAGAVRAALRLPGRAPVDVAVVGDILWILVTQPPALLRARVERGQIPE
jgi:DNA-binding beta-propeller fold protein YncE